MHSDRPDDTDPATWLRLVERWRSVAPAEKGRRVGELNAAVRAAALIGIRLRHPDATPAEQRLYLLTLLYGDELVKKAYGWDPAVRGR